MNFQVAGHNLLSCDRPPSPDLELQFTKLTAHHDTPNLLHFTRVALGDHPPASAHRTEHKVEQEDNKEDTT